MLEKRKEKRFLCGSLQTKRLSTMKDTSEEFSSFSSVNTRVWIYFYEKHIWKDAIRKFVFLH